MKHIPSLILFTSILTFGLASQAAVPQSLKLQPPKAIHTVAPEVPYEMTRWAVSGAVTVSFTINQEGVPENIIVQASDNAVYSVKVLEAVRQWRFEPPKTAGVTYLLPVKFS